MVKHGVGVVEDVQLGDRLVAVVFVKLPQAPIGEIVMALAFGVVAVEGKAKRAAVALLNKPVVERLGSSKSTKSE